MPLFRLIGFKPQGKEKDIILLAGIMKITAALCLSVDAIIIIKNHACVYYGIH